MKNPDRQFNTHLPIPERIDENAESLLRGQILTELEKANTLEDLARAKNRSLNFRRDDYRMEIHRIIMRKFEENVLPEAVKNLRKS